MEGRVRGGVSVGPGRVESARKGWLDSGQDQAGLGMLSVAYVFEVVLEVSISPQNEFDSVAL